MPHVDGWPALVVVAVTAVVVGLIQHLVVATAVIASLLALVLLVLAIIWGRRLWRAYYDLNVRVEALEVIVGRED